MSYSYPSCECEDRPACGCESDAGEFYEPDGSWMDGDALASVGWGTDEDYGYYGEDDAGYEEGLFGDA